MLGRLASIVAKQALLGHHVVCSPLEDDHWVYKADGDMIPLH